MSGHDGRIGDPASAAVPNPVRASFGARLGSTIIGLSGADANVPAGIVLDLASDGQELRVDVVDASGTRLIALGPFPEEDIIAVWRSLAEESGLPPMMRVGQGAVEPVVRQLGKLRLGTAAPRRRRRLRSRPRFLVRRKMSRLPPRPVVHREMEIAAGAKA